MVLYSTLLVPLPSLRVSATTSLIATPPDRSTQCDGYSPLAPLGLPPGGYRASAGGDPVDLFPEEWLVVYSPSPPGVDGYIASPHLEFTHPVATLPPQEVNRWAWTDSPVPEPLPRGIWMATLPLQPPVTGRGTLPVATLPPRKGMP